MRIEWTRRRKVIAVAIAIAIAIATVFVAAIVAFDHARVRLRITPERIEACERGPIEADVEWLAPGTESIQIFVYGIGEKPKLWASAASRGRARTGEWINDGTTILLTDDAGKPLARRTIEAAACPQ